MSDTTDKPKLGARAPLGLKRTVETGKVKQSFSHGRSNTVVVEVKKRRILGRPGEEAPRVEEAPAPAPAPAAAAPTAPTPTAPAAPASAPPAAAVPAAAAAAAPAAPAAPAPAASAPVTPPPAPAARAPQPVAPAPRPAAPVRPASNDPMARRELQERLLREAEEARLMSLEEARRREDRQAQQATEEERRRQEENRRAEEESRRKAEEEAAEAARRAAEEAAAPAPAGQAPAAAGTPGAARTEEERRGAVPRPKAPAPALKRPEPARPGAGRGRDDRRHAGKLTVTRALSGGDDDNRARSLAALRRAREKEKRAHQQSGPSAKQVRDVVVPETITVGELANRMAERGADLVKSLFKMGMVVTVNQTIDQDTAELLVTEFGHNIKRVSESDVEIGLGGEDDAAENLQPRPPVVTIMGHVDHGKTSLLDAIRGANVVSGEAGGITQHIGAYQVQLPDKSKITFLDTPGHEAFTEMRQRGANVTDIVVLVVAADDGLKPQTVEAINHTKAAGVPMIVAINKIDKDGARPQRVREELLQHEIVVEDLGGDVQDVEVSALKKTNLDGLLEAISLQAELLEITANPDRPAEGAVVEAKLDKGRGPLATVLVQRGTLRVGDIFVVGAISGKVRAMIDDKGRQVKEAGPSVPVEVLGLSGVPSAGDVLTVVENEARAREVADYRQGLLDRKRTTAAPISLENMFASRASLTKEFPLVIKADVQGSAEAIASAINRISTEDIRARILHTGVGGITESDVVLASASKAPIIGFNVRPNAKAREIAERNGVEFRYYDVIYHLTDWVKQAMAGELGPEIIETVVGRAEVKEVFPAGKKDKAAGLLVLEGVLRKGLHARLTRQDVIVSKTTISSLRRFKDDVAEVRAGLECGVLLADTNDIKAGDHLEVFEVEERARTL
ncbi:translation initiation factor IF-2 [Sphingosinicella sp. BN140058]|uniref:translation initiation factor IF-2 n=1 Tax=Sphingosinicella sp. BN140058 TaxID=1892855 RepID=UPI00101033FE|nr:translation initiation factor IF-2 [Sphingosinicella sp. BN140058]QAY76791.1 translation initiation factor IF-2 [Sphingosinicella sp. BN140058]